MIGETRHRDHYPTLFERWQGVFHVQCPIYRAPQTMAFVNPVMVHWGKRPVAQGHRRDSTSQPSDCEAMTVPLRHQDALSSFWLIYFRHIECIQSLYWLNTYELLDQCGKMYCNMSMPTRTNGHAAMSQWHRVPTL